MSDSAACLAVDKEGGRTGVLDFITRLFGQQKQSRETAKERLRLVLIHDRASISPSVMGELKEELIAVISRYMEIDEDAIEINLSDVEDSVALVANIPVKNLKRTAQA